MFRKWSSWLIKSQEQSSGDVLDYIEKKSDRIDKLIGSVFFIYEKESNLPFDTISVQERLQEKRGRLLFVGRIYPIRPGFDSRK